MSKRFGHRGYIGSRPYDGQNPPQHVQNLVIRDFCQRNGFTFLLSVAEYAMPGCYMMLEEIMREAPRLEGVVLYSVFMLPESIERRKAIYEQTLGAGGTLHGAVENLSIVDEAGLRHLEDILVINRLLRNSSSSLQKADGPRL